MAKTIGVEKLADAIIRELKNYNEEVIEQIKISAKKVAEDCTMDIKEKAPKRTGKYRRGWKKKVAYESKDDIRVVVYNKTAPQLTHLLEFGHAKVNGGRVEGKPHIAPAEQKAAKAMLNKVKVAVKAK